MAINKNEITFESTLLKLCSFYFLYSEFWNKKIILKKGEKQLFPITILSLSVSPLFTIKSKFMNHLGKISYGIYMYHAFAIQMVGFLILKLNSIQILPSSVLIFLSFFLVTTITILIAHISYVFFEKKLISLKKRYR